MDKIYLMYHNFFRDHDITLADLQQYQNEGYELHINPDTIIWDSELKFMGTDGDDTFIMVRPKGYNEAEAEDNPFAEGTEIDEDGDDYDDED